MTFMPRPNTSFASAHPSSDLHTLSGPVAEMKTQNSQCSPLTFCPIKFDFQTRMESNRCFHHGALLALGGQMIGEQLQVGGATGGSDSLPI